MRTFEEPNISNDWKCPICETNNLEPVVLIGIEGTQEGNNIQAEQFHLDCIELLYIKEQKVLIQELSSFKEDK